MSCFKRKSRTSALPPIPDIIAASHRLASHQSDPRRGKADRGERRQAAGTARCGENSERQFVLHNKPGAAMFRIVCTRGRDEAGLLVGYPRVHALSVGEK
jgi:hypothetical protein